MKTAAAYLLFTAAAYLGLAAQTTTGDWSAPDHGLRARLRIEPAQELGYGYTYRVILELQNVGIVTNLGTRHDAIALRFASLASFSGFVTLSPRVSSPAGSLLPVKYQISFNPPHYWWNWGSGPDPNEMVQNDLILPPDATISFPVAYGGDPQSGGYKLLSIDLFSSWLIPSTGGPYSLSGSIEVPPPKRIPKPGEPTLVIRPEDQEKIDQAWEHYRGWRGKLALPPVVLPQ